MSRSLLSIAAALMIVSGSQCFAQVAVNPAMRNALLLVQLDINGGRLQAKASHQGRTSSSYSSTNSKRTERMTVRLTGADPRIDYNLATPTQRVTIVVSSRFDFYVRQDALGASSTALPLRFTQPPEGDLRLSWGESESSHQLNAPSLWHLCLAEPDVCRQHLLPLLELLRPDWKLAETADQIDEALSSTSLLSQPLPWQRWHSLVAELGADEYAVRHAADRQLRAAGPAARSFLENYDRRQLDSEQRHRLRTILRALSSSSDNSSPEAIASWLATDPRVWLAMLSSKDSTRRQLAKDQLGRLLQEPIDFDPAAEAPVRQDQIEILRRQLSKSQTSSHADRR
jgi:hypothetical protein